MYFDFFEVYCLRVGSGVEVFCGIDYFVGECVYVELLDGYGVFEGVDFVVWEVVDVVLL